MINAVSHLAITLDHMNHMNFDPDPHSPTSENALKPRTLLVGDAELTIRLQEVPDWRAAALVIRDQADNLFRAVVSLDREVSLERWQPETTSPKRGRRGADDWVPVKAKAVRNVAARALLEYVHGLTGDEILDEIRALNAEVLYGERERLNTYHEALEDQKSLVEVMERNSAVLAIPDPTQRAIAIRMAAAWGGTTELLLAVAAEVARPVVLPLDAPPPTL